MQGLQVFRPFQSNVSKHNKEWSGTVRQARDQETWTKRASDQKRERSESVINDEPRKPQRKEYNTNVPWKQGRVKRTRNRNDYELMKRQAVAIPSRYKCMKHPDLPICSILEPGTPAEQYRKWLNDNPPRIHKIHPVIDILGSWRKDRWHWTTLTGMERTS